MSDFCNKAGYNDDGNTGSVRDYFYDQSLGKVTYTQSVTQIVTLPNPRNYYNFADYPTNNVLRDTGEAGQLLIIDAVTVLKAHDFNFSNLTKDATKTRSPPTCSSPERTPVSGRRACGLTSSSLRWASTSEPVRIRSISTTIRPPTLRIEAGHRHVLP